MNRIRLAKPSECTGCMGCLNSCNHDVLDYKFDRNGYFRIEVKHQANCVHCGLCSKVCPVVSKPKRRNEEVKSFAAWNTDNVQRKRSASGGAFSALASYVLINGGVVYGATINGFKVIHRRIDSIDELSMLQGTKYQLSDTRGIYLKVKQDLLNGLTVLFSGMSCQIAALYNFLGKVSVECLYTIDTICGGYSSMLPMMRIQKEGRYAGIVSFRDKDNGWKSRGFHYNLKMQRLTGGVKSLGTNNYVLKCFSSQLMKQSSCLQCKFNGAIRISDMTIGDFWQDNQFEEQHYDGLSCVIAHNEKAMALLGQSDIVCEKTSTESVALGNPNLYWSQYKGIRYLPSRFAAIWSLRFSRYKLLDKLISYTGFLSLDRRLYLRYNNYRRKKYFSLLRKEGLL